MKKQVFYILTTLALITVAGASQAYGQWVYSSTFDIPFDFSIRGRSYPAGVYTVGRGPLAEPDVLMISSNDRNRVALFRSMARQLKAAPQQSQLVFRRVGDHYRLEEVRTGGLAAGREVLKTKRERWAEQQLEARGAEGEQVVLVASR